MPEEIYKIREIFFFRLPALSIFRNSFGLGVVAFPPGKRQGTDGVASPPMSADFHRNRRVKTREIACNRQIASWPDELVGQLRGFADLLSGLLKIKNTASKISHSSIRCGSMGL
ncbi:MAG: hypothetical protein V2B19_15230 [Pseudomonadota bacterium]